MAAAAAEPDTSRCVTVRRKTKCEREEPSFMPVAAVARFFCPSSISPKSSASDVTYASVAPAMYTWPRASSRTWRRDEG